MNFLDFAAFMSMIVCAVVLLTAPERLPRFRRIKDILAGILIIEVIYNFIGWMTR